MIIRRLLLLFAAALAVSATGCGGAGAGSVPRATVANAPHSGNPAAHQKSARGLSMVPLGPCPQQAVFLRLPGEIRGYPLSAVGSTAPCTDIVGAQTLLTGNGNGYGDIAVSVHGDLHALAFQDNGNGGLLIFEPDAAGNAAPFRAIGINQDHVALAVDSKVNDYVVASEGYANDPCWYVVPINTLASSTSNCDANVQWVQALAVTPKDELVAIGTDVATSAVRVDVFANAASATPTLVRSIVGSATGLPTLSASSLSLALATDPVTGTIYVYSADGVAAPKVSEFDAAANGDVAPLRILTGPNTGLPSSAFAINVLAVDASSNLYVNSTGIAAPEVFIGVFAPGVSGNATPEHVIEDDTLLSPMTGGIAVRV